MNIDKQFFYTGNCVNSFDEDTGEYLLSDKMKDVSEFGLYDEKYVIEKHDDKTLINSCNGYLPEITENDVVAYIPEIDMIFIYIISEDVHYFYE